MKNAKFFYRIDGQGNPIPGTLARLPKKPITGLWRELLNICCPDTLCEPAPVQFNCIDGAFYLEMVLPGSELETPVYTDIFTGGTTGVYIDFQQAIPRGIFDLYFFGVPDGQNLYINGEVVGTGPGDVVLLGYDTTNITQIGYCPGPDGGTMSVEVDFVYLQLNAPLLYTPEQVAERVQMRIYANDGVTLLGQTTLGGGNNQVITGIPVGFVKIAVYTAAWEDPQLVSMFAGNIPYAGSVNVGASDFFPAGEFMDEAAYWLTSQYQVEARGTNEGGN